ncbi:MAG: F0F1 ATP synthase subunit B [Gammaproteobacteria bacterium]|nr:MAG: F0F1 ATP synthase subunit B [Gammaproteobacteria bacterium]
MNLNATMVGQSIVFLFFVVFCWKFVWPPLVAALQARKKVIADGLAAAERGQHDKERAQEHAKEVLKEAKQQAAGIIGHAQQRAAEIVEESRGDARVEGERLLSAARAEIDQEVTQAREHLRGQVVTLAVAGAGKVLEREIDEQSHTELLNDLAAQI